MSAWGRMNCYLAIINLDVLVEEVKKEKGEDGAAAAAPETPALTSTIDSPYLGMMSSGPRRPRRPVMSPLWMPPRRLVFAPLGGFGAVSEEGEIEKKDGETG